MMTKLWKYGLLCWLSGIISLSGTAAVAQIQVDDTLGAERSIVTPLDGLGLPIDLIDQGAQRGTNLFHSFLEFNVDANRGVYFSSPDGIENILARVTGMKPSQILGTLGTFGAGSPNLFLINPNGIIFGQNAKLDVAGSFVATTANGVGLGETGRFSASKPETSTLLSINPDVFFFNQLSPEAEIVNRSTATFPVLGFSFNNVPPERGLQVIDGRSLLLVGGNVRLEAGGRLNALGGRIELGGLGEPGTVGLDVNGDSLRLNFAPDSQLSDVTLADDGRASVRGTGGGNIVVNANNFTATEGGRLVTGTEGAGDGGDVIVNANTFSLSGQSSTIGSGLYNQALPGSSGNLGDIRINAKTISLIGNLGEDLGGETGLYNESYSDGNAGNIFINSDSLNASLNSGVRVGTFDSGNTGDVVVNVKDINLSDSSFIESATVFSQGNAGNVTINTEKLVIREGSNVASVSSDGGSTGTVSVNALELVELSGISADGLPSSLVTNSTGNGETGDITITTKQLVLRDGTLVSTDTLGASDAGDITITASESVTLSGTSTVNIGTLSFELGSGIVASTEGSGDAGNITISTGTLTVQDGGSISALTGDGSGDAGNLTIRAAKVEVSGESAPGTFDSSSSRLSVQSSGTGNAGILTLETEQLMIRDGGNISALTVDGSGNGGVINIRAKDIELIGTTADGVDASGLSAGVGEEATGNGGIITVETERLTVRDSAQISSSTSGNGNAGAVTIQAEDIELIGATANGSSGFSANVGENATGSGGNVVVETGRLILRDGAKISSSTDGQGDAGSVTVQAENIELIGTRTDGILPSEFSVGVSKDTTGNGGTVTVKTERLIVRDGAQISSSTLGQGNAGAVTIQAEDIELIGTRTDGILPSGFSASAVESTGNGGTVTVETEQLMVRNGAQISSSTFGQGNAGSITVRASDMELIGTSESKFTRESGLSTQTFGAGNGGNITVETERLILRDGAKIASGTAVDPFAEVTNVESGRGGTILVTASEFVELIGTSSNPSPTATSISSAVGVNSTGTGGDVIVNTGRLTIRDGAELSAATAGIGDAGSVNVHATNVELMGSSSDTLFPSRLSAEARFPTTIGNGGSVTVETEQLTLRDRAQINVSNQGIGNAGILNITANTLNLDNQGTLTAETNAGEGGDITLQVPELLMMRRNSLISAEARGEGNSGNIGINTQFVIAIPEENSDIIASAFRGGNIEITAQGIFGTEFRERLTPLSDITATGTVTFNLPDVDPNRGLLQLPTGLVDPTRLIDRSCNAGGAALASSFIFTGRGGIPPSPLDVLESDAIVSNWVSLDEEIPTQTYPESVTPNSSQPRQIIEAQGWVKLANGQIILVAESPTVTPQGNWQNPKGCKIPE
ncbi:MAG: filamentous hemagglutinin N-terminal domain-containing protein [Coleofasciculus sp. C1-SOL-03]|uniref:two-partner secretion domain-containing protein n=1 Tax=Coleofasciculus sp. C1-SOL-03 TaxID=3069522 RepID=UPI0032F98194